MAITAFQEMAAVKPSGKEKAFYIDVALKHYKNASNTSAKHFHSNIELIRSNFGKLKIDFLSESIILNEGDFIFINSSVPHNINAYLNENEHYCIKFEPFVINTKTSRPLPEADYFFKLLPDYAVFRKSRDSGYIHYLFKRCKDNFTHNNFFKRLVLQAAIMEISAYIFERQLKNFTLPDANDKNTIFFNTSSYINKNYSTVTLEDAAKNVSMSYSYFSRVFKREFHTSFSKYITNIRVQKSMEFLTGTDMSIADIAMECGFSNLSHYIKCFKEEKGITPNKFRSIINEKSF